MKSLEKRLDLALQHDSISVSRPVFQRSRSRLELKTKRLSLEYQGLVYTPGKLISNSMRQNRWTTQLLTINFSANRERMGVT